MKHFIVSSQRKSTKYGYLYSFNVYQIKRNKPDFIGSGEFNSGSWLKSEAFYCINKNCEGFKRLFKRNNGYYFYPNNLLTITQV